MAEEKAQAVAAAAPQASGSKPMLFIVLAVFNMLIVGGVGVMIYLSSKKDAQQPNIDAVVKGEAQAQAEAAANPVFIGKLLPLETLLVNLAGSRGQKLVKISMELELSNDDVQKEIDRLKPKIRDIIIIITSSKTYEQLATPQGKDELREQIRDQVNLFLTKGHIKKVYFTEFLYN